MTTLAQPKTPTRPQAATSDAGARRAIVVGGGLAGLASAVELASHGVRVTIVERNTHLGGKMNVLSEGGFSFDMGPTIITLPQVLRGIVRRSGRRPEDYINLINLDPQWRCMYEDGAVIDLRMRLSDTIAGLDKSFPGSNAGQGFKSFVEYSRRMLRLSEKVFFYRDLGGVADMMKTPPTEPGLLGDVLAMRMHSTVGGTVHKHIAEPHTRQMCEHFLQYVGSSPFLAPAILSLIAACQTDHGCWYPMGGTRMVARTLSDIAKEQGIDVRLGVGVAKINHDGRRATGVTLDDGSTIAADVVISNCDVQRTNRSLIDLPQARSEARSIAASYTPACSGVVLYLGLSRQYDHLAHHNFLFSKDSHQEFDDIYAKGIPARDPSIYLAVPSRTDPDQAPPGHEAFYALIHTPYLRPDHHWEGPGGMLESYRRVILDKLARFGMRDIEQHIKVERFLTPSGIERLYNAEGGAIYGLASHGKLKGGFKPKNRSRVLKGLYLAGGSANPGPGVPMVLMSGVTAARCACQDLGLRVEDIALGQGVEVTT
ncbi:MAG: phytoene desaturase [Tepidisphaera sp.]|nr:phytoene desaturase [Tepidisphaera sp.]